MRLAVRSIKFRNPSDPAEHAFSLVWTTSNDINPAELQAY